MRIESLFIRETANEGREFDVPDMKGMPTGEKITLRHSLSDMGRAGRNIMQRQIPEIMSGITDDVERANLHNKLVAKALAYLVVSWSFEDECTLENAQALFENAPHLIDWADKVTSEADGFFGKASFASLNTPKRGRGSKSQPEKEVS